MKHLERTWAVSCRSAEFTLRISISRHRRYCSVALWRRLRRVENLQLFKAVHPRARIIIVNRSWMRLRTFRRNRQDSADPASGVVPFAPKRVDGAPMGRFTAVQTRSMSRSHTTSSVHPPCGRRARPPFHDAWRSEFSDLKIRKGLFVFFLIPARMRRRDSNAQSRALPNPPCSGNGHGAHMPGFIRQCPIFDVGAVPRGPATTIPPGTKLREWAKWASPRSRPQMSPAGYWHAHIGAAPRRRHGRCGEHTVSRPRLPYCVGISFPVGNATSAALVERPGVPFSASASDDFLASYDASDW